MISAAHASTNPQMNPEMEGTAPGPLQRVLLTFTAPSRAFARLGSGGWWLPYLLLVLVSLGFAATIGSRVGWETVTRNTIALSPKQQARMDQVPPAQQTQQIALVAHITQITTYLGSVLGPLIFAAVVAGVLLATFNFALGAHTRFGSLFTVYFFSTLPQVLKVLLATLLLLFGAGAESFQLGNPLGSNPAFYLMGSSGAPSGVPHWALAMLGWFDVFLIWQLILLAIGCSILAKVSRGKAAAVVFGWAALAMTIGAVVATLS